MVDGSNNDWLGNDRRRLVGSTQANKTGGYKKRKWLFTVTKDTATPKADTGDTDRSLCSQNNKIC